VLTYENRVEYARLALETRLHEGDAQLCAIRAGLSSLVPISVLQLYDWRELEGMVTGQPEIDLALLREHTICRGCEQGQSPEVVVEYLWQVCFRCRSHDPPACFPLASCTCPCMQSGVYPGSHSKTFTLMVMRRCWRLSRTGIVAHSCALCGAEVACRVPQTFLRPSRSTSSKQATNGSQRQTHASSRCTYRPTPRARSCAKDFRMPSSTAQTWMPTQFLLVARVWACERKACLNEDPLCLLHGRNLAQHAHHEQRQLVRCELFVPQLDPLLFTQLSLRA